MSRRRVYRGPVVFANGSHYTARGWRRRLLWDNVVGVYRHARRSDPSHFDLYHSRFTDVEPA